MPNRVVAAPIVDDQVIHPQALDPLMLDAMLEDLDREVNGDDAEERAELRRNIEEAADDWFENAVEPAPVAIQGNAGGFNAVAGDRLMWGVGMMPQLQAQQVPEPAETGRQRLDRLVAEERQQEAERRRLREMERFAEMQIGRNRGARVVIDDGREIPANIMPQPIPAYREVNLKAKTPYSPPKEYIVGGVIVGKHKFSRQLTEEELMYYRKHGYKKTIIKYEDLLYVEKEVPINDEEECIVLISELADYLATEECKRTNPCFDIKEHNDEYQEAYKKHVKTIVLFKRNKNG